MATIIRRARRRLGGGLRHAAALGTALVFVLPLIWVVSASLRKPGLPPPRTIEWWPDPVAWSNYARIFTLVPMAQYLVNSLIVVAIAVPLTIVTASWAGFALAQLDEHWRRRLITLSVLLLMVPITALWLTRYVFFTRLGLIDSFWALAAPAFMGSSPFFVLLFYWTFRRIPHELFEVARLEGAGPLQIWRLVALPMAAPTLVAVSVLSFALYWGDFINPLLYLKSDSRYTLPVGVQFLQQMDRTNWPLLMAAAVLMSAPVVLVFLLGQRYFLDEERLSGMSGR
jgi:multiple sugar transport system permease protein